MEFHELLIPIIVSLVGALISGAAVWIYTITTMVKQPEMMSYVEKKEVIINHRMDEIEHKIEKERQEIQNLFDKDLQNIRTQMDYIVAGINEIKESMNRS